MQGCRGSVGLVFGEGTGFAAGRAGKLQALGTPPKSIQVRSRCAETVSVGSGGVGSGGGNPAMRPDNFATEWNEEFS